MKNIFVLSAILLITYSCKKFEYSPYQVKPEFEIPHNVNSNNIEKILAAESAADDTVTVIFSGDSQRFYDRLQKLVAKVNTLQNVDFLIMCGDIADFGALQEYLWIQKEFDKLNVPYLCTIGNHDVATNNGDIYESIYGVKNYSMLYKGYKFVFHDTNGREYNFNGSVPNMYWLDDQLNDPAATWFVGVSHVPPYNTDFDRTLEEPYKNLFASTPGFLLSLHGHVHDESDYEYYHDGVRYLTSNSVEHDEVVLLKFINGQVIKQMIPY